MSDLKAQLGLVTCPNCDGAGQYDLIIGPRDCEDCGGTGVLVEDPPPEVERGKCGECGHEPHQGRECFAIKVTPDEKWDELCKCGTGREGTNG